MIREFKLRPRLKSIYVLFKKALLSPSGLLNAGREVTILAKSPPSMVNLNNGMFLTIVGILLFGRFRQAIKNFLYNKMIAWQNGWHNICIFRCNSAYTIAPEL